MTPGVLLEQLRARGITLQRNGETLLAIPKAALTEELRALIRDHKAELLEGARWAAGHPDVSPDYRRTVGALLAEIDAGKRRLEVAIRYAARLRR